MQAITAYKVLGGWAAAGAIGGVGANLGKVIALDSADKRLYTGVGGIVASVASGVLGYVVAKKPNLASAGYAQLVASGLGVLGYTLYALIPLVEPLVIAQRQDDRQYLTSEREPDNRRLNLGPGGTCVCLSCGAVIPHVTGKACFLIDCPVCGAPMTRQTQQILA